MTLKDVEKRPFGLKGEFIDDYRGWITYYNVGRVPVLDRLERYDDYTGLFDTSFDAVKEEILINLAENEEELESADEKLLRSLADFVVHALTNYDFRAVHGVGIEIEEKKKWGEKFPNLCTAFNLGLISIPDEALSSIERLKELERELINRSEELKVDLVVKNEDSLEVVSLSLADAVFPGVMKSLRERFGRRPNLLRIKTPYFEEKAKQFPVFRFRGEEFPSRRALEVDSESGLVYWTEYSPVEVNRKELIRILLADLKEAEGVEGKIKAVEKFLDELKEALKNYYDRHPFNRETKIEGRLIEFLKEKVYLWTSEANEFGPAYTEPENFEPVWEGKSLLDGETGLRIYRHREYPVYFVAGGEFGMGAPNFGAVIVEPTEEEVELLKYLTFDQLRAVPSGANRIRKEGELFVIEANYCSETGLETYRLNPDEIAEMIALERGYGSGGPEM